MSQSSAYPPHRISRVSRRAFLHSSSLVPAAFASSELLRPAALAAMPCANLDGEAVEACGSSLPLVADVPLQPLVAQVTRLLAAAEYLGAPLPAEHRRELEVAFKMTNEASAVMSIQRVLDCHCLVGVEINPQMRVKVAPGPARPELVEQGWRQFLVKVHNQAGTTAVLIQSPACLPVAPGAFALFARSKDPALNGMLPPVDATFSFNLVDTGGAVEVRDGTTVLDAITWPSVTSGVSKQLDPDKQTSAGNDDPLSFCPGTTGYGDMTNKGTPKAANAQCP